MLRWTATATEHVTIFSTTLKLSANYISQTAYLPQNTPSWKEEGDQGTAKHYQVQDYNPILQNN